MRKMFSPASASSTAEACCGFRAASGAEAAFATAVAAALELAVSSIGKNVDDAPLIKPRLHIGT